MSAIRMQILKHHLTNDFTDTIMNEMIKINAAKKSSTY